MSDANFSLIFDGSAVDNGEIGVKDLVPSRLALSELTRPPTQKSMASRHE